MEVGHARYSTLVEDVEGEADTGVSRNKVSVPKVRMDHL